MSVLVGLGGFFFQVISDEYEVGEKSSMRTKISFETSPIL